MNIVLFLEGWPYAFAQKQFVSSPFLVDMDLDGKQELAVATKTGEIFFFSEDGMPIRGKTFKLDKLQVRQDWFEGFDTHQSIGSFTKGSEELASQGRRLHQSGDEGEDDDYIPADYEMYEEFDAEADDEGEEEEEEGKAGVVAYVHVDPHILATPVVEDLDGDGYQEIIVPVSYYFDRFLLLSLFSLVFFLFSKIIRGKYPQGNISRSDKAEEAWQERGYSKVCGLCDRHL